MTSEEGKSFAAYCCFVFVCVVGLVILAWTESSDRDKKYTFEKPISVPFSPMSMVVLKGVDDPLRLFLGNVVLRGADAHADTITITVLTHENAEAFLRTNIPITVCTEDTMYTVTGRHERYVTYIHFIGLVMDYAKNQIR